MKAKDALADYRKASDPAILSALADFKTLSPMDRQELLYLMICNTNLLVTAGATVTPVPAAAPEVDKT